MKNTIDLVHFIRKTYNQANEFIPLHAPRFSGNEKKYVLDTIESSFVSSVGEYVNQFETKIAKFTKTAKAAAVVNGTSALQVSLRLAGVQPGDEVLTQALTFVATTNAISYNSAQPIFIDVDRDTMGMSPKALETFLEKYAEKKGEHVYNRVTKKRIAACLPMHTFGYMCRIDEILEICKIWNIPVIEDAAEALGSSFNGKPAGSFGMLGAFSFNGNKIITSGGGGAIVSKEAKWAEQAKHLTTTAKIPHPWEYEHDQLGYNFRMPNLNAALLCAQLEQFEEFRRSKKNIYSAYQEFFDNSKEQTLKPIPAGTNWNYWLMSIELADLAERNSFLEVTNKNGIMTRPIWKLAYKLPMYKHCQKDEQENAQYLEDRIVNIPSSVGP